MTNPVPLPEPVGYQIRLACGRWTHCAKHIHEAAVKSCAAETRALHSADQMISFRAAHAAAQSAADNAELRAERDAIEEQAVKNADDVLALRTELEALRKQCADEDIRTLTMTEVDDLRERVKVLEDALRGMLAGEDVDCTLEAYAAASNAARAALEAK